jgi:hypothetical protein
MIFLNSVYHFIVGICISHKNVCSYLSNFSFTDLRDKWRVSFLQQRRPPSQEQQHPVRGRPQLRLLLSNLPRPRLQRLQVNRQT